MSLFRFLFSCMAIARCGDSRFGRFISRLGPNKFPFSPLRELICKVWFGSLFLFQNGAFWEQSQKFPAPREKSGILLAASSARVFCHRG
jgi:hypothetical protein